MLPPFLYLIDIILKLVHNSILILLMIDALLKFNILNRKMKNKSGDILYTIENLLIRIHDSLESILEPTLFRYTRKIIRFESPSFDIAPLVLLFVINFLSYIIEYYFHV